MLPVLLRAWFLALRREHKLIVLENTLLRKMFGPKKQEVRRRWRKLHNKELQGLCSSPDAGFVKVFK
jgi:hypothetical protein